MPPTTVEIKLEDVLVSIQKDLKEIRDDLTDLKVDMATVKADLASVKEDVKDLKNSQRTQIWALIITVIGATLTAVIKFGFFPNP
ncbi:MAG: hypothetical protein ACKO1W_02985 [Microcystaceae cyanobacterium]|nr:hypothetical protein [Merismopediaceae bacterium]